MFIARADNVNRNPKTIEAIQKQIDKQSKPVDHTVELSYLRQELQKERKKNEQLKNDLSKVQSTMRSMFGAAEKVVEFVTKSDDVEKHFSLAYICGWVSKLHGVSIKDMRSRYRGRKIVLARHAFGYWARELTDCSFPEISAFLGQDHTTIIHGVQSYKERRTATRKKRTYERWW